MAKYLTSRTEAGEVAPLPGRVRPLPLSDSTACVAEMAEHLRPHAHIVPRGSEATRLENLGSQAAYLQTDGEEMSILLKPI